MILGASMARRSGIDLGAGGGVGFVVFPLVVHAMDCVVSAAGIMSVGPDAARKGEDPYGSVAVSLSLFRLAVI